MQHDQINWIWKQTSVGEAYNQFEVSAATN